MVRKLKVLYISAECGPYARTGGLGDVAASLPAALALENISIIRLMPLYRSIKEDLKYCTDFPIQMNDRYQSCIIKRRQNTENVPTYFVGNDYYFNRDNLYGYYDDGERFLFFCKAAVEMLKFIPFKPDIIHCNDWHTALIPLITESANPSVKTVFTIHNLRYTGSITADYLSEYKIPAEKLERLGYPDNLNFIKSGILFSDFITTVSKGYADEILTSEYDEGLDNILRERKDRFVGILNGIDNGIYNPQNAAVPFDTNTIDKKEENKSILRRELGLDDNEVPIVAAVTRLDEQKGIDLILNGLRKMNFEGFQFILLGTGSEYYENMFDEMSSMYRGKMAVCFEFNPGLANRIYAGSDIFIMPSKFEPCGLGQLYAMAYGTVPVVRSTGGLKDTVFDLDKYKNGANGFCFEAYSVSAFSEALKRAIRAYKTPAWEILIRNGMASLMPWESSAAEYIRLYRKLLNLGKHSDSTIK